MTKYDSTDMYIFNSNKNNISPGWFSGICVFIVKGM